MAERFYDVRLSEREIALAKVALHELRMQVKLRVTRSRCSATIEALRRAEEQGRLSKVVDASFGQLELPGVGR